MRFGVDLSFYNIFLSVSAFALLFCCYIYLPDSSHVTNYAHSNHDLRCDLFVLFILSYTVWRLRNT